MRWTLPGPRLGFDPGQIDKTSLWKIEAPGGSIWEFVSIYEGCDARSARFSSWHGSCLRLTQSRPHRAVAQPLYPVSFPDD